MKDVLLVADHDGVPGVGAALAADDPLHLRGQQIDDLAFALIAPLDAHNRHNCHELFSVSCCKWRVVSF